MILLHLMFTPTTHKPVSCVIITACFFFLSHHTSLPCNWYIDLFCTEVTIIQFAISQNINTSSVSFHRIIPQVYPCLCCIWNLQLSIMWFKSSSDPKLGSHYNSKCHFDSCSYCSSQTSSHFLEQLQAQIHYLCSLRHKWYCTKVLYDWKVS